MQAEQAKQHEFCEFMQLVKRHDFIVEFFLRGAATRPNKFASNGPQGLGTSQVHMQNSCILRTWLPLGSITHHALCRANSHHNVILHRAYRVGPGGLQAVRLLTKMWSEGIGLHELHQHAGEHFIK